MPFPIGAVIGAVAGIGQGILGGMAAKSSADAQNEALKKRAEAQYKRAKQEWKISNVKDNAQWRWDMARVEQLRFNERQAKADYNVYTGRMIAAAMKNLEINRGALYDKYVTEETLRATQVGLDYGATVGKLGAESTEALRQYLGQINQAALASSATVSKLTGETQELLGSMALDEQRDQLGWQVAQIAGMARDAEAKGVSIVRQGGGATAQRLATDAAKELGRKYGELVIKSQDRGMRVELMNRTMNSDVSKQLGQTALQMQDAADKMKFTNLRYMTDYDTTKQQLEKLVIPGFGLANKQYQRELTALQLQTQQVIDQASMPYREQVYFDPLKPIKGLKPEMLTPTYATGPSAASIIGNSILGGFQGAMQFSYQKQGGGIGFF